MIPEFRRQFDFAQDVGAAVKSLNLFTERTWTPTLTFATPGDLAVVYTAGNREGRIFQFAQLRLALFQIVTSTFTHSTATGNLQITGLPDAASLAPIIYYGYLGQWQGITKANYTQVGPQLGTATVINFIASGSGQAVSAVAVADVPSGGNVRLRGAIIYKVNA